MKSSTPMWNYWGMAKEDGTTVLDHLAEKSGRLQAQVMCLEHFLESLVNREGVPDGVQYGARHYLASINELRKKGDLP